VLIAFAFLIDSIVNRNYNLHFGKDDGLTFRLLSTCIIGSLIFFIKSKEGKYLIIGFVFSLLSYILVFVLYVLFSFLIYGDNRGFDFPQLVDQLISSVFISILFGSVGR
jgi:hypothetical protein